jgi:signal transduction histidine kinase
MEKTMTYRSARLSQEYQAALLEYVKRGTRRSLQLAQNLGDQAIDLQLETLDLVRIHERTLMRLELPSDSAARRGALVRRAGTFFAAASTPMEKLHHTAVESSMRLKQLTQVLSQRTIDLAATKQQLKRETGQRRLAEQSLRKSEQHYARLLGQSQQMQERLRQLSRQLLLAQEEERKKISRELHDVIAQTLTSINVRLAKLRTEATLNTRGIERSIVDTERLVQHSVDIVHRFARELRPTVLDDLGLIPALHTHLKSFRAETGIRICFSAAAAVEKVKTDKRTVLYRVAQEALNNIARHAHASEAKVELQVLDGAVCMKIIDNGKGFRQARVQQTRKRKRLGLLGMKERLEMVGGNFTLESEPGKGTVVVAQIPIMGHKLRRQGHDGPNDWRIDNVE